MKNFRMVLKEDLKRFRHEGDRHRQYHSTHPSGFEEFSCGALIDSDSRTGHLPGDPVTTDPMLRLFSPMYRAKEKTTEDSFLLQ